MTLEKVQKKVRENRRIRRRYGWWLRCCLLLAILEPFERGEVTLGRRRGFFGIVLGQNSKRGAVHAEGDSMEHHPSAVATADPSVSGTSIPPTKSPRCCVSASGPCKCGSATGGSQLSATGDCSGCARRISPRLARCCPGTPPTPRTHVPVPRQLVRRRREPQPPRHPTKLAQRTPAAHAHSRHAA